MFVALPASIANLEHLESLNLWNNVLEVMYYSSYILVHWCLHCYIPFLTCRSCLLLSVLWGIWKYWMLGKSTNIIILSLWVSQSNSLSSSWLLYGNWLLCYSMNRLCSLPRGFGGFPALEVLDLTYNNLNHASLPQNFCRLGKNLVFIYTIKNIVR